MAGTYILPFRIQRQSGRNWCWAANAASISYFYEQEYGMTQCQIANKTFIRNDCCQNLAGCDSEGSLKNALGITNNLADPRTFNSLQMGELAAEINSQRVVGAMIQWPNLYTHFISIYGYDSSSGTDYVVVGDPQNENIRYVRYEDMLNNYGQVGGCWIQSYRTGSHHRVLEGVTLMRQSLVLTAKKINVQTERTKTIRLSGKIPGNKAKLHAHAIYSVDIYELQNNRLTFTESGYRIIRKRSTFYLADFSSKDNQLINLATSESYVGEYLDKWQKVRSKIREFKKHYKIQILTSPQLGIESFMISFLNNDESVFVPVINTVIFPENRFYSEKEYLKILHGELNRKIASIK